MQRGSGGEDLEGPYVWWAVERPVVREWMVGLGGREAEVRVGCWG